MAALEMSAELQAMVALEQALSGLDADVQQRVLRWANERFGGVAVPAVKPAAAVQAGGGGPAREVPENRTGEGGGIEEAETLAEFYDRAGASTDGEKVLVASYWFQFREGAAEIEARHINTQLKHLGHGVGNVTRAFESLKSQKPALIVQTRKDGSTKQAQKKFKVTSEGKKAVERMLAAA